MKTWCYQCTVELTLYFMYLFYLAIMKLKNLTNLLVFMSHLLLKQLNSHEKTTLNIYHHLAIIFH